VAQDSQEESPAKMPPQAASTVAEPAAKPEPDASAKAESCSVEGTVVSASGSEPLRGSRVTLSASDADRRSTRDYTASTDREGRFAIRGVAPGRYIFKASKPGYVAQSYRPNGNSGAETILELFNGQKVDNLQFKLSRAAVVLGRVTDEDGEPVVGVQVEALVSKYSRNPLLKGQWVPVKVATTNDLGEYRIFGLNPGGYYVAAIDSGVPELSEPIGLVMATAGTGIASTEGEGSWTGTNATSYDVPAPAGHPPVYYPGVTQREQAVKIRVSAGQETRIDISLQPDKSVTVSGRVLDVKGKPAAQTAVLLRSQHLEAILSSMRTAALTDAEGKFEMKGVSPGSYFLTANSTRELKSSSAEQPLEVSGEDITGLEVQLSGGIKLSGKLVAAAGSDVDLTQISVLLSGPSGLERFGFAEVKKDGAFSFPDLHSTTYGLQVNNLPDGWYVSSAAFGGDNVLDNGLKLGESTGDNTLDVKITPGAGQLDGIVLQGDDPVPGATVKLLPEHAASYRQDLARTAMTDQRGRFVIKNVVPGGYRLLAVPAKSDGDDEEDSDDDSSSSAGTSLALAEKESKTVQLKLAVKEQ
jgi:protocatechuate 3,4-dioxygenase beta subunit